MSDSESDSEIYTRADDGGVDESEVQAAEYIALRQAELGGALGDRISGVKRTADCYYAEYESNDAGYPITWLVANMEKERAFKVAGAFRQEVYSVGGTAAELGPPVEDEQKYAGGMRQRCARGALVWVPGLNGAAALVDDQLATQQELAGILINNRADEEGGKLGSRISGSFAELIGDSFYAEYFDGDSSGRVWLVANLRMGRAFRVSGGLREHLYVKKANARQAGAPCEDEQSLRGGTVRQQCERGALLYVPKSGFEVEDVSFEQREAEEGAERVYVVEGDEEETGDSGASSSSSSGLVGGGGAAGGAGAIADDDDDDSGSGASSGWGVEDVNPAVSIPTAAEDPLAQLTKWLALKPAERPELNKQSWATAPLSKAEAAEAKKALFEDYRAIHKDEAEKVKGDKEVHFKDLTMKCNVYFDWSRGGRPEAGWPLVIAMHGGGACAPDVNDQNWRGICSWSPLFGGALVISPRSPRDAWNMWFEDHIDDMFEKLIQSWILTYDVDPSRVYLFGFSAGGDGAYQVTPRMADHFAGGFTGGGHPNDSKPLNLRNTPFCIHMGGDDSNYRRNEIAPEKIKELEDLKASDAGGYEQSSVIHPATGHSIPLERMRPSVEWMLSHRRKAWPSKVVWFQAPRTHPRMYWLGSATPTPGDHTVATAAGQKIAFESLPSSKEVRLYLADELLDMDKPVTVALPGGDSVSFKPRRTIADLHWSLQERYDPELMASSVVTIKQGARPRVDASKFPARS